MAMRLHLMAAVAVALMPAAALAERGGNGKSGDHARGNSAAAHANRDSRNSDETLNPANGNSALARANPSNGFCPPGLAKREDGCVPPGQAAAGVTAADWAEQRGYKYVPGAELDPADYALLPNYADYGLPDLPEGEVYAVIDRTAVVIDPLTETLIRLATR